MVWYTFGCNLCLIATFVMLLLSVVSLSPLGISFKHNQSSIVVCCLKIIGIAKIHNLHAH